MMAIKLFLLDLWAIGIISTWARVTGKLGFMVQAHLQEDMYHMRERTLRVVVTAERSVTGNSSHWNKNYSYCRRAVMRT
jgi:hypothetical protein